jgi:predicted nucleic acid-binding Zn ribbon protein
MPTYVYEVISESGASGERFEVVQTMADPPLTHHPETGQPVRRVFLAPWIAGKHARWRAERALSDDSKLERLGFTKYVKSESGYERAAGSGPDLIKKE